jgi:AraC family transcriptional regulator
LRYTGSSTIEWPGMVSQYAILGPHSTSTTTGPHQIGIGFSGHLGLVRAIDGRAGRYDAAPGAVYVTGPSPIAWLEVTEPTEALEIYPDRALVDRRRCPGG